jgi:hypothetical protein
MHEGGKEVGYIVINFWMLGNPNFMAVTGLKYPPQ